MQPKRKFATTVRLIERNFADNRTINAPKFYRYFLSNFANLDKFRGSLIPTLSHSVVKDSNATIVGKTIGNGSQVVWSTASLVSLIIHSTGWEDISKLTNGPIAAVSDVLVCCLSRLCYLALFTHSCLNYCTDLSGANTENKCCCPFIRDIYITVLAPIVQMFYSEINPINHYPVHKYY